MCTTIQTGGNWVPIVAVAAGSSSMPNVLQTGSMIYLLMTDLLITVTVPRTAYRARTTL